MERIIDGVKTPDDLQTVFIERTSQCQDYFFGAWVNHHFGGIRFPCGGEKREQRNEADVQNSRECVHGRWPERSVFHGILGGEAGVGVVMRKAGSAGK